MADSTDSRIDVLASRRAAFPIERIERMVDTFYARVRDDDELGPIFDARIDDWPFHLGRMVNFWRAVLRSESSFTPSERGTPPELHRQIAEMERHHFQRWLSLFDEVVDETHSEEAAPAVKSAARRIAVALSRHLPESGVARS